MTWLYCKKCGKFLPKAALSGLGAGVCLILFSILAVNIFLLQSATAEWTNEVCRPIVVIAILFSLVYVVLMLHGDLSLCASCIISESSLIGEAIKARDATRRSAISSRRKRMDMILKDRPDLVAFLEDMKSGRRAGWRPDESTLILLRHAQNLERWSRHSESASIFQRLGLDRKASLMKRQSTEESPHRNPEIKIH